MMRRKTNFTNVTPIPAAIPRQLALDILHSHGEIITLNPLVTDYGAIKAPRDAPADEYYSTWYEIEERVQFVPGLGKMGTGKIKFKGCFHDMPWGLQTHIYAPMNVDLRNNWRIAGNQPGEPRETPEIGIGAPSDGLYLREDVEIKCNVAMVSFVKKEMKAASKVLVDRLIKKAELLDSGALMAMMENGRLKTINPADRTGTIGAQTPDSHSPDGISKTFYNVPQSPTRTFSGFAPPGQYNKLRPHSGQGQQNVVMELPGDTYYHPQLPQYQASAEKPAFASELSGSSPAPNSGRWSGTASDYQASATSRPASYATDTSGLRSPRLEQTTMDPDLKPMQETREEYERYRR